MRLSPKELSQRYNIPLETAEKALANIKSGKSSFITVSGKIGAGKDTVAPILLNLLEVPEEDREHEFFARPLKVEITTVIDIIRDLQNKDLAIQETTFMMNVSSEDAETVVNFLYEDVLSGDIVDGYTRTKTTRSALQFWGTDVRRKQDDNYWVKKAIASVMTLVSMGRSVYITDSRFPNEVTAVSNAGGRTVRLLVSEEEQSRRIFARDGIEMSEDARSHISETALDGYDQFDVAIDTDNLRAEEAAREIVKVLNEL